MPYYVMPFVEGQSLRDLLEREGSLPVEEAVKLEPEDPSTEGMVRIPGFTRDSIEYGDYFMDRYEVTNRAFKAFVDAGGYRDPDLWIHAFVRDGVELAFEEAMGVFTDQTGRPGPSTWRLGTFQEGQAEFPVGGVSWHEAAAYARWAGKELSTTVQWERGRLYARESSFVTIPRSNLEAGGPRPVGAGEAMTTLGIYDLAGNVREWCYNEAGEGQRATRGGAWVDAPFHVGWVIPKSAFDRDETHGFRLIRAFDDEAAIHALRYPVERTAQRDYTGETPVSDAEFEFIRRYYQYDPFPLNPTIEQTDTFQYWIREKVYFEVPYGERGGAFLYLPRGASPPYQTVIYWAGVGC